MTYRLPYRIYYVSTRYGKAITVPVGYESDGATHAIDLWSEGWWVHDWICQFGRWDDGTPINNWEASTILGDILRSEGRPIRSVYWRWATWLFGGGAARRNGMWPPRKTAR